MAASVLCAFWCRTVVNSTWDSGSKRSDLDRHQDLILAALTCGGNVMRPTRAPTITARRQ
jgi:hypothetical protein